MIFEPLTNVEFILFDDPRAISRNIGGAEVDITFQLFEGTDEAVDVIRSLHVHFFGKRFRDGQIVDRRQMENMRDVLYQLFQLFVAEPELRVRNIPAQYPNVCKVLDETLRFLQLGGMNKKNKSGVRVTLLKRFQQSRRNEPGKPGHKARLHTLLPLRHRP